jgi:Spy/CpxP family protein refolding chaperone
VTVGGDRETMKKLVAMTFVGSAILAASVWAARGEGGQGPGRAGRGFDVARLQAELGLSDDQVAEIQKMKTDGRSQAVQLRSSLRTAHGELQNLLQAPAVDEKAISAKVKQVTDLEAAATQARVAQRLALRRILTPEQLAKMDSLKREHHPGGRRGTHAPPSADAGSEPEPSGVQ